MKTAQQTSTEADTDYEFIAVLKGLLDYDPDTGHLTWKKSRGPIRAGARAGTVTKQGTRVVPIENSGVRAYKIVWAMCHGEWPKYEIEFIDGDPDNLAKSNLRMTNRAVRGRRSEARHPTPPSEPDPFDQLLFSLPESVSTLVELLSRKRELVAQAQQFQEKKTTPSPFLIAELTEVDADLGKAYPRFQRDMRKVMVRMNQTTKGEVLDLLDHYQLRL